MSAHVSGGLQTGESQTPSLVTIMQEMRKRAEADTSHGEETPKCFGLEEIGPEFDKYKRLCPYVCESCPAI